MAKRQKYDKAEVIADWKTGKYTERALAGKHKISPATAHNIVSGIDKTLEPLISKQVEINQELSELSEQEVSKFKHEVDERSKHIQFFKGAHMLAATTAVKKLRQDGTNASYQEINSAVNALAKAQESVLGKEPSTVINNTNTANASVQSLTLATAPPEMIRQAEYYQELDNEY